MKSTYDINTPIKNQIFIILAATHQNLKRVARPISATWRLDNTAAPKQHCNGGEASGDA